MASKPPSAPGSAGEEASGAAGSADGVDTGNGFAFAEPKNDAIERSGVLASSVFPFFGADLAVTLVAAEVVAFAALGALSSAPEISASKEPQSV